MVALLNILFLFAYAVTTVTCTSGAGQYVLPKGNAIIDRSNQKLTSRAACDIPTFKNCLVAFFGKLSWLGVGLPSTTLPTGNEFQNQLRTKLGQSPPQGFQDICEYIKSLSSCAPPADCWTVSNTNNISNGQSDISYILPTLLQFQYVCTTGSSIMLKNYACVFSQATTSAVVAANCTATTSCSTMAAGITCLTNALNKACNADVGNVQCNALAAAAKVTQPTCNATNFDICTGAASGLTSSITLTFALSLLYLLF